MTLAEVDITPFKGLIFSTAARYAPLVDDDLDDVQQLLALKVAQAIVAFDRDRAIAHREDREEALRSFVFACMTNRVKDLLKEQSRRNQRRGGIQLYVDDVMESTPKFEITYLCESEDVVFFEVEDERITLPSTLTMLECRVVQFLMLDYNQTEISVQLGVSRAKVRKLHASVQEKMQDWKPGDHHLEVERPTPVRR